MTVKKYKRESIYNRIKKEIKGQGLTRNFDTFLKTYRVILTDDRWMQRLTTQKKAEEDEAPEQPLKMEGF